MFLYKPSLNLNEDVEVIRKREREREAEEGGREGEHDNYWHATAEHMYVHTRIMHARHMHARLMLDEVTTTALHTETNQFMNLFTTSTPLKDRK